MKRQINFIFLLSFLFSQIVFGSLIKKEGLKAYVKVSFENQKMFSDNLAQSELKAGIEEIFKGENVDIAEIEKPDVYEEYKFYINISIKDSLIINAKGVTWDLGTAVTKYPRSSSVYENESDIYAAVKEYIRKYITGKS